MRFLYLLVFIIPLTACERNFQFHPNEIRTEYRNLNEQNILKIGNLPLKDTFKFIFTGDTQLALNDVKDFVSHANGRNDIMFVLLNGDLTEFGLNSEFLALGDQLVNLAVPFVSTIGNHDMLANGRRIFGEMFGAENFSFSYNSSKFIFLNTSSREVGFDGSIPDLPFLQTEINNAVDASNIFFISHVAPFSRDFDEDLIAEFTSLVSSHPSSRISLHGHDHSFSVTTPYGDNFPYLVTAAISKRSYSLITVSGQQFSIEEIHF